MLIPKLLPIPFAENGRKNAIPDNRTSEMQAHLASFDTGFPPITMQPKQDGGLPPDGMDMNGILYDLSSHAVYQNKGGQYKFDAEYAELIGGYPKGAILLSNDETKQYISVAENNKDDFNDESSTNWKVISLSDIDVLLNDKVSSQTMADALNLKLDKSVYNDFINNNPISSGYNPLRQYYSGDIVKINGVYYECYNQNGCNGIDPTDPKNRPSGWVNPDIHSQYYWVQIGRSLVLPEIGSPIPIATTQIREGLIKYRNDAQLSATKFWRIAEQNPNLVKNGFIEIADLRANVIRGLDDGKGYDLNRVINSFQEDAIQKIIGNAPFGGSAGNVGIWDTAPTKGAFYLSNRYFNRPFISGSAGTTGINVGDLAFDSSKVVRSAVETRMKNIAMYYCCRI